MLGRVVTLPEAVESLGIKSTPCAICVPVWAPADRPCVDPGATGGWVPAPKAGMLPAMAGTPLPPRLVAVKPLIVRVRARPSQCRLHWEPSRLTPPQVSRAAHPSWLTTGSRLSNLPSHLVVVQPGRAADVPSVCVPFGPTTPTIRPGKNAS